MADPDAQVAPEPLPEPRKFKEGEVVLLKAVIVQTRDLSNHVVDCAGVRFTASAEGLAGSEPGLDDMAALEDVARALARKRQEARRRADEAARAAAKAAGPEQKQAP